MSHAGGACHSAHGQRYLRCLPLALVGLCLCLSRHVRSPPVSVCLFVASAPQVQFSPHAQPAASVVLETAFLPRHRFTFARLPHVSIEHHTRLPLRELSWKTQSHPAHCFMRVHSPLCRLAATPTASRSAGSFPASVERRGARSSPESFRVMVTGQEDSISFSSRCRSACPMSPRSAARRIPPSVPRAARPAASQPGHRSRTSSELGVRPSRTLGRFRSTAICSGV